MEFVNFLNIVEMVLVGVFHFILSIVSTFVPRVLKRKKDIKGQTVLITGAGSGLGRQLAIEFSKHETCLILVDIDEQSLLQTATLLDSRTKVFNYVCDVSDYKMVYEMAEKVKREAGDVDILVNNAGIVSGKYLVDLHADEIMKTLQVNVLAHFWTYKAFIPAMMEKNRGHLVIIASIAAKLALPKCTDYCASKFAAVGLAETIELEMRERGLNGIKFTIACPAQIDTGLFQGAKMNLVPKLSPEYVAKEIVLGVLEEKELMYLSTMLKYFVLFKQLLPRVFAISSFKITGNLKVMEHFTGRKLHSTNNRIQPS